MLEISGKRSNDFYGINNNSLFLLSSSVLAKLDKDKTSHLRHEPTNCLFQRLKDYFLAKLFFSSRTLFLTIESLII
jgi:hypothetical protein